jgi:hypothetical protein
MVGGLVDGSTPSTQAQDDEGWGLEVGGAAGGWRGVWDLLLDGVVDAAVTGNGEDREAGMCVSSQTDSAVATLGKIKWRF